MTEPTTSNIGLIVPNTGDLPGAWSTAALNPNFSLLDGTLGGTLTLSLSAATTITLTTTTATFTPTSGPFQSNNACIFLSGTLTGNSVIQFSQPGTYKVHNKCTGNHSFYVQLAPASGTGNAIGAPPGRKTTVFFDGTNMDYVDMGQVGDGFDLRGATAIPPWIASACTVPPYVLADGSTYSASVYPILCDLLGSTFGGNGITTFAVPDERARARVGLDTNTNGGVTNRLLNSGVTGTTMASAGGNEALASHTHAATVSPNPHSHADPGGGSFLTVNGSDGFSGLWCSNTGVYETRANGNTAATSLSVSNATTGTGASGNVQPTIVSFLPLIRAA